LILRVAIIVRSLKIGGMERVAISLAEAFESNGHESHLIYFKNKKDTLSPTANVKLHHFNLDRIMLLTIIGLFLEIFLRFFNMLLRKSYPFFKGFFTSQIFKIKLAKLEKEYGKFDLIIVRGQGTLEMIYQNSDPRIVAVSENVFSYGTMNKFLKNIQIKALYENRNILGVSNAVSKIFKELEIDENFKSNQILKITNPIDVEHTQMLANLYEADITEPFILSVGRVVPGKNLTLLVEAYSYARKEYNVRHKLVIVGDGSDMPLIQKRVRELSLENEVYFKGQLTNPFPWMKKAELFILSSKFEGLGMVLLESMACETKVVATKSRGGVADIMKDELNDYLADQTAQDLGSKIALALQEKRSIDFKKYLQEFTPATIVNEYIDNFLILHP